MVVIFQVKFPRKTITRAARRYERFFLAKQHRSAIAALRAVVTTTGVALDATTYKTGGPENTTGLPPYRLHLRPDDWPAVIEALQKAIGAYKLRAAEKKQAPRRAYVAKVINIKRKNRDDG
jgi:hypothetical protein